MVKIHLVTSLPAAEAAVKKLLCVPEAAIAVRCQGVKIDAKKGTLTSVTCCTADGEVYVFDVKKCEDVLLLGGLIRVFQSTELVKVVHDCSTDNLLLKKYGVKVRNYFDTAVAYSVILEQRGLPPRKISLQNICDKFGIERFRPERSEQIKLREDVNYFGLRPMSRLMLNICASYVLPLIPSLYHVLAQQLETTSWEWFDYMSEENRLSKVQPERISSEREKRKTERYLKNLHLYPITRMSKEEKHLLQDSVPDSQEFVF
ncbi:hypothetical protein FSP39_012219 [Pinctada imbricata]|uniref:3'-5' exonuclease domain-containing protein n=1 Tax=Pinctada imbricata TaxID=66713 RepID=A0AA89C389_PINIB|nr:hypothetical protein FSP39_012219 [Pinctada imbricata]